MKKIILLLFLFFTTAPLILPQSEKDKTGKYRDGFFSSIGIIGGIDNSGLSGDAPKDVSYSGNFGFTGGLSIEFNITNNIKLLLQPVYSLKSVKILYDIDEEELFDSLRLKFDYFRFPLLVKFTTLNEYTYFLSGFDAGYLSKAVLYDKDTPDDESDIAEYVNKFDLSAMFGVGINFKIKTHNLYAELRYSQSILNMSNNDVEKFNSSLPTRFRLSGLQFLLGYNFNI